jgi:4-amino-4-deoxy-L-arabinose transferase-like glycosyltransferase
MPSPQFPRRRLLYLALLAALVVLPALGSTCRLTYHEAFVAQGAREMLESGHWAHPTIGDLPWLEKPPLPWWLVAGLGWCAGGVTETIARLPFALATITMVMGVALLSARYYGTGIGLLAGAVQATTAWTVIRGRLAEADVLLACLITWCMVAFGGILLGDGDTGSQKVHPKARSRRSMRCWAFFVLLGLTALVKGIGFGGVLLLAIVATTLLWERNRPALQQLWFPLGWMVAAGLALAWPLLMVAIYGWKPLLLWTIHVTDRLTERAGPGLFAGESWWEYALGLLGQALPWTPCAVVGAYGSLGRALRVWGVGMLPSAGPRTSKTVVTGDRLFCAWAIAPLGLLTLATVKNAHYAISAQVPWSVWAALGLARLGKHLQHQGHTEAQLRVATYGLFLTLALSCGLGYWLIGPWFNRRGVEWAFYEASGRQLSSDIPLAILYDDWDRKPYENPFGPIPHDLAVRLFYLHRPVCWYMDGQSLAAWARSIGGRITAVGSSTNAGRTSSHSRPVLGVIARERDRPLLEQLGQVEVIASGPTLRHDRTYVLFRITIAHDIVRSVLAARARTS